MLLFLLIISLTACKPKENKATRELYALDTIITLTVSGQNSEDAIDAACAEIKRLENLLSATKDKSDVWKINHSEGKAVSVSSDTAYLLEKSMEAHSITNGSFDITIYEVLKLWGFTTGDYHVPSSDSLNTALESSGIENLTKHGQSVTLKEGTSIDLGGIAKGYIGDRVADVIKEKGCDYAVISLGGNIRTVGEKTSGEPFVIGIEHPENGGYFATVETDECSVITSGAYQRNFTEDGKFYHHIINPETGYPSDSSLVSVTVIGKDGALCDALSTAIFINGTDYAKELYYSMEEFSFILLSDNEELFVTENLKEKLTLEKGYENIKISYFG